MSKLTPEQKQVVTDHIGYATALARKHRHWQDSNKTSAEDLEAEAFLGLVEAATSWDPEKGPFIPWARLKIKFRLQLADQAHAFPFHVTREAHTQVRDIRRAIDAGATTQVEVAELTGISGELVATLWPYAHSLPPVPLNPTDGGEGWDVPDPSPGVEQQAELSSEQARVRAAVDALPGRLRDVVLLRFGFEGEPMSAAETAKKLGLTVAAVETASGIAQDAIRRALADDAP